MVIVPEMIGSIVGVYNGKTFNQVEIKVFTLDSTGAVTQQQAIMQCLMYSIKNNINKEFILYEKSYWLLEHYPDFVSSANTRLEICFVLSL